jgi:YfiR/HmsC-like
MIFCLCRNAAESVFREAGSDPVSQAARQSGGTIFGRWGRTILVLALLSGVRSPRTDCQAVANAERAEAAYLKKILSFVEWPSTPGTPDEPFRVCVAPDYKIAFPLSEELRGITMKGRKIDVRMVRNEQDARNCQLLFIGSPEPKLRARLLESVKGTQMLTVGDDAGFLEAGGILEFAISGSAFQFSVNLPAAKRAGLKIDSRLLAIAQRVLTEKGATGI